ncbi:pyruvate kinase 2, cytosolic-like [Malania oleifera]|uniref:pyruvate kinase 2, cytosolic-like n=1 Tax=Malania oleifera TaxID=397392 RepID=UPI0025AEA6BC|nr:pyruvate kinase 2, cytosolic-like [Malania oleifera]
MPGQMAVDEPLRLASVLTSSKPGFLPSLTKIVGTLGPKTRSVEIIEACLNAGMSVARFDFSWLDEDYHQGTLDNLRIAVKNTKKLCAIMLDTVGPELQIYNKYGNPIELKADDHVTITPDATNEPSAGVLPVNYAGLSEKVKKGDTIFLGQYLFTGSETTSVWLEVLEAKGPDVICIVKNSAILSGFIFTMHVAQVHVNLPTLNDIDKQVISSWGSRNNIDFVSLSYTRHVEDVRELKNFLKTQNLHETRIFAKVETVEGLKHFDEILKEADGVILSRGNLGIDLPPEKVFLFQKSAVHKCNMVGKPAIITRVVDSMTQNLRPTRAEATDVANAVLDGTDGILLGAETVRGLYPVEAIKIVGRICAEAENVYNQSLQFKRIVNHVGEPMSQAESVASSAVRAAIIVKAAIIVVFTSSGGAARLIAKYRPSVPVLAVVVPRPRSNSLKWTFTGSFQARQLLGFRGVFPFLASPDMATAQGSGEEPRLKLALNYGKSVGLLKHNDQVVVFQKVGDSSVVKIVEIHD